MKETSHLETELRFVEPSWNIMSVSKENTHDQNCYPNQLLFLLQDELYLLSVCQVFFMSSYICCGIQDVCTKTTAIIKDLLFTLSVLEQELADSRDALEGRK